MPRSTKPNKPKGTGYQPIQLDMKKIQEQLAAMTRKNYEEFYLKPGETLIRILPPLAEDGISFFVEIRWHYISIGKEGVSVPCLQSWDEPCPVCDRIEEHPNLARGDNAVINSYSRFYVNGLILGHREGGGRFLPIQGIDPEIPKKVQLPYNVQVSLLDILQKEEYCDALDWRVGRPFIISRKGSGRDTRYEIVPYKDSQDILPWWEEAQKDPDLMADLDLIAWKEGKKLSYEEVAARAFGTGSEPAVELPPAAEEPLEVPVREIPQDAPDCWGNYVPSDEECKACPVREQCAKATQPLDAPAGSDDKGEPPSLEAFLRGK